LPADSHDSPPLHTIDKTKKPPAEKKTEKPAAKSQAPSPEPPIVKTQKKKEEPEVVIEKPAPVVVSIPAPKP